MVSPHLCVLAALQTQTSQHLIYLAVALELGQGRPVHLARRHQVLTNWKWAKQAERSRILGSHVALQ